MKLVGIEFHGFKSFADSADIRFHDGITAIVGPNGCGKSNVADGLRWVLGEQRPTAIRGSRMEEAIFQGTARRKAIHRAEVMLRLSNEDHLLPVPYTEVEIGRTVYTGGESEYRLNGTLCRLRDIQDLCRDTGLGTNAYAIIEGRMVDAILSDKAEERRAMFEEAAGIGRYKERRRIATRRLDEADADLARVDDLISEVATKVRSLARQRGRAKRYLDMRERKLALELALAHAELTRLQGRHGEIDIELESLGEARVRDATQIRTTEAEHESLKARLADLERERADSARQLMAVRDRLAERERQRLLAEERGRNASARLDQLSAERRELEEQQVTLQAEIDRLKEVVAERKSALGTLRDELGRHEIELAEVSERRQAMEAAEAAVESEQQAYRERRAELQARGEAARAEAEELARRLKDAERRSAAASAALDEVIQAEEEARREAGRAEERHEQLSRELERARERLTGTQALQEELRGRRAALAERIQATAALIEDLTPLTTGDEGLNPAVQAALGLTDELGVLGILGRGIEVPEAYADGLEAYLGAYMEGLVVNDADAAQRVRRWFLDEYDGPGGLVILPLDRLDRSADLGVGLPPGFKVSGPGAPWIKHLLREVSLRGDMPEGIEAWIGRRESLDSQGVLRLGRPYAGGGTLARRAELERLRTQLAELESESDSIATQLRSCEDHVATAGSEVGRLAAEHRVAEEDAGRLAARAEAAAERIARAREESGTARETVDRLRRERSAALQRRTAEQDALRTLRPAGDETAPDPEELAAVRSEWEEQRERVTEIQLNEARAAAALDRAERELSSQQGSLKEVGERLQRLSRESEELSGTLTKSQEDIEGAAADLETLFEEREVSERGAREMDERAEEMRLKVNELESLLRRAQQEERGHAERRHELELERIQIDADLKRTRERLEDEWGRPFEQLSREVEPADGDPTALRAELTEIAGRLGGIGLVNMLAEEEYREEKERLEFLEGQRADLAKARDDLRSTIRQINETASAAFLETLKQIRVNFKRTFATLFQGGECDVWLESPDDPLDSPVEISASPGGKRTQRIHLLSGGERALTALALLFAIYLVKPSPFCVLDEVDAPLDETNIRRFVAMLEEFKPSVQFIVITHNPVTIEAADWIYGVTMEEPGVSKVVGVEFSEYARGAVA
ncbi:MAG: AAA family ATPase [Gemmatimonadetes bacterium]|nr:AAA family ATPase [Gemmatimonadota bacterium]NIO30782.1 AAA family ATPase [Gemmatimonadota bacterium]